MILVPGVTLDKGTVTPTSANPVPDGERPDNGGKGNGDKGKGDHGGNDAGAKDSGTVPTPVADAGTSTPPPTSTQLFVPSFWIDATEVTVASYRECVTAGVCGAPAAAPGCTFADGLETHPITCVTPEQSRVFCTWLRKRLVRYDEYTAAAGGASQRPYPWGAEPPAADRLNACGGECTSGGLFAASDGFPRTAPTGSFPSGRTPEGVHDLAGNAAEWVESGVPVARGGSYEATAAAAVSTSAADVGAAAGPSIGFRCAADAAP
jgi:formylglycine-generating enzyme required for sulfatase activity